MELLILAVVFFLVMYFLVIRPQKKRTKAHTDLISSLNKGDEVTTAGGMLGRVSNIGDNFITLEVDDTTTIKIQKQSISAMMPKGTIRSN